MQIDMQDMTNRRDFIKGAGVFAASLGGAAASADDSGAKAWPETDVLVVGGGPAGVCAAFVHIYIDPLKCTGCCDCADVCPEGCIEGKAKFIHMIDEFECTKCGKCVEACEEEAIVLTAGKLPKLPSRLTKVGKFKKH